MCLTNNFLPFTLLLQSLMSSLSSKRRNPNTLTPHSSAVASPHSRSRKSCRAAALYGLVVVVLEGIKQSVVVVSRWHARRNVAVALQQSDCKLIVGEFLFVHLFLAHHTPDDIRLWSSVFAGVMEYVTFLFC